jgi:hypothetical protein
MTSTTWQPRKLICSIKPLRPPPSSVVVEVVVYPLRLEARPQIKYYSPHWSRPLASALHTEEISPQQEVRRYPQIRLTEVNKRRHYGNGVGNKMYQLQFVVIQQTAEEVPRGEVEAALEEGSKDDLLLDQLCWSSRHQNNLLEVGTP